MSYFQRFSQRENHATDNTLLVLRHLHQSSPFKLGGVLALLLETGLSIGLTFEQQVKGAASVPDALIHPGPASATTGSSAYTGAWPFDMSGPSRPSP